MKKIISLILTIILSISLVTCNSNNEETTENIESEITETNIDISELLKKENPTDEELEKIVLELSKPENNLQAWFLDGAHLDLATRSFDSDLILQNEDPNDQGIYSPVGRFNTLDELISACLNLVTESSMENYFYDYIYIDRENSIPFPAFKEVDGKLYYNIGGGAGVPIWNYTSADILSKENESEVIMLLHFLDYSNENSTSETRIQYENGAWKVDYTYWYN